MGHVLPGMLIAHSPTGKYGHGQFGATKASILHGLGDLSKCSDMEDGGVRIEDLKELT